MAVNPIAFTETYNIAADTGYMNDLDELDADHLILVGSASTYPVYVIYNIAGYITASKGLATNTDLEFLYV